jgi:hypothetical protein
VELVEAVLLQEIQQLLEQMELVEAVVLLVHKMVLLVHLAKAEMDASI